MYRKSYCNTPDMGIDIGGGSVSKMLKFDVKVSYVTGKTLSGELSSTWTSLISFVII